MSLRRAVVLFNLGGPDSIDAVKPFLNNLFYDRAIIDLPNPLRWVVARLISARRIKEAQAIYAQIGGRSPLVPETEKQAAALQDLLTGKGETKVFVAMRYWHPLIEDVVRDVNAFGADEIVLLPLFSQFSTTTTGTIFQEWDRATRALGMAVPTQNICCYPTEPGWVSAHVKLLREALQKAGDQPVRILFSAHGLPKHVVAKGDPYPDHVAQGVDAIVTQLGNPSLDWATCYQSRVGPLEWIGPQIDDEIARAAEDGVGVVVVPIAFVSEHSETLVELDRLYADRARDSGVTPYIRVPAIGSHTDFINGLATMVNGVQGGMSCGSGDRCCVADNPCCLLGHQFSGANMQRQLHG